MRRELDERHTDGLEVALFWHQGTDKLTVSVRDANARDEFELEVEAANALDAFRHPYAYAASSSARYARPVADRSLVDG